MFELGFYLGGGVGFCGGLLVMLLLSQSSGSEEQLHPIVADESWCQPVDIPCANIAEATALRTIVSKRETWPSP